MMLLEYEAKKVLHEFNVPTPRSYLVGEMPAFLPAVLKSQVPVGGRGKAGGIITVVSQNEYNEAIRKLLTHDIKGHVPKTILAEEKLDIKNELYVSIVVNKRQAVIELIAHKHGGVEVESNKPDEFLRSTLNRDTRPEIGEQLAEYFGLETKAFILQDIVDRLYDCFIQNDAVLIEINPLAVTTAGTLIAADCKMEIDDAARFRHPEWQFEQNFGNVNFVTLNENGQVATIANGAGLAMATVDGVTAHSMTPANFLDIGGGANEASVLAAFEKIVEYPNVSAIVINIFAGITRCDEVARAIVSARAKIAHLPPLFIRLTGTNFSQAEEILHAESIPVLASLDDCLAAAKEGMS